MSLINSRLSAALVGLALVSVPLVGTKPAKADTVVIKQRKTVTLRDLNTGATIRHSVEKAVVRQTYQPRFVVVSKSKTTTVRNLNTGAMIRRRVEIRY
ncbi:MAG: hypothetical protein DSM106950_04130 [Stigonema ocellatum SAG 48.90 = DSM 106950]|nr:hypothetical protein [Stigonema ocellatum SAG 48.90 = DSM 106950]